MKKTRCKYCGREMVFIFSKKNEKPIPCDPDKVTVVTDDGEVVTGRISHFATCEKYPG